MFFLTDDHYSFINNSLQFFFYIIYKAVTISDTHPLRILLVDDDVDDCVLFRDAVAETGLHATVDVAHDGVKIMQLFNTRAEFLPHLIFLDLNMPVVSGNECLREIRRASYLNSIPVIIFSTSCSEFDIEATYSAGANLYIQKPTSYLQLISILKKVLLLDWRKYLAERQLNNYVIAQRMIA
jgi:CheY-like chemotaxis protein